MSWSTPAMRARDNDDSRPGGRTTGAVPTAFAIPLRARAGAEEWEQAQYQLAGTLDSVLRQTNADFQVIVCGHDKPALPDDPRVTWIEAQFGKPETAAKGSLDKTRKRKAILRHAARVFPKGFYYFLLDSDDLLHRRVNAFIQETGHRNGYYISSGYFLDISTGRLASSTPEKRPFYKSCGSCAAIRFSEETISETEEMNRLFELSTRHTTIPEAAATMGFPLQEIPFPAAVYILNHGVNLSNEQGKSTVQTNHANLHGTGDKAEVRKILSEF